MSVSPALRAHCVAGVPLGKAAFAFGERRVVVYVFHNV